MELVDTHCHLQFEKLKSKLGAVLTDATSADVKKMICVGTNLEDSEYAVELAKKHGNVWAAAGIHPHDATSFITKSDSAAKLKELAAAKRVVAVGETGLDYYRLLSPKEDQLAALKSHISIGLELNLPFIFHVRDAWEDFWPVVDSYKNLKGVVHSFSSDTKQLNEILKRGFFVGLNGIMTFTNTKEQLQAAKSVPLDRLLLETDAPFLTPAPHRGELCEPKHVGIVAEFLVNLRNDSFENLARATTKNAVELFRLQ